MKRTMVMAVVAGIVLAGCEGQEMKVVRKAELARAPAPVVLPVFEVPAPQLAIEQALEPAAEVVVAQSMPHPLALVHECPGHVDHLARARTLREAGDLKSALLEARRALQHGDSNEVLEEGALIARRTGERELAMRFYMALADKVPAEALPLVKLARLSAQAKDWEGVLAASAEAILRDPMGADGYHLRGRAHLNLKRLSNAIRDFRKAAALDPSHGWAFNNLGYAYLQTNEPEKAVEPLEEAARLLPEVALVHNNLGLAYAKSGDKESAREAFAVALELKPEYVKAMVNKARLTQLASAGGASMTDYVADGYEISTSVAAPSEQMEDLHAAMEVVWPGEASIVTKTMDELTAALTKMLEKSEASGVTGAVSGRLEAPELDALKNLVLEARPEDDLEELRIEAGGNPLEIPVVAEGGEI